MEFSPPQLKFNGNFRPPLNFNGNFHEQQKTKQTNEAHFFFVFVE